MECRAPIRSRRRPPLRLSLLLLLLLLTKHAPAFLTVAVAVAVAALPTPGGRRRVFDPLVTPGSAGGPWPIICSGGTKGRDLSRPAGGFGRLTMLQQAAG